MKFKYKQKIYIKVFNIKNIFCFNKLKMSIAAEGVKNMMNGQNRDPNISRLQNISSEIATTSNQGSNVLNESYTKE